MMHKDLGIVLPLDKHATELAFEVLKKIKTLAPVITAIGPDRSPHITLFQGRFPEEKIGNVLQIVENLSIPVEVKLLPELIQRPNGNLFWLVKKTDVLQDLHRQLLVEVQPLTDGQYLQQAQDVLNDPNTEEEMKERIRKYGNALTAESFLPHVTLCRIKDDIELFPPPTYTYSASRCMIYSLRNDGSIIP